MQYNCSLLSRDAHGLTDLLFSVFYYYFAFCKLWPSYSCAINYNFLVVVVVAVVVVRYIQAYYLAISLNIWLASSDPCFPTFVQEEEGKWVLFVSLISLIDTRTESSMNENTWDIHTVI